MMEAGVVEQGSGPAIRNGGTAHHVNINKNNRVGYVQRVIRKRKYCRRPIKRRTSLQQLFVSCRHVFKGVGTAPSPHDVQNLCSILDEMKPEDLGLSSDLLLEFFKPPRFSDVEDQHDPPKVTYTTIYKSDRFSLCIFFIPPTGVIPLHNHPGMTVFSKLLIGNMHIKSYDWVDSSDDHDDKFVSDSSQMRRLARVKADRVFTAPCKTSVLYPTSGGNIHAFTALTPCAVLDVLGPPYSTADGRDCSYYKDYPYSAFSGGADGERRGSKEEEGEEEKYGWLEEIEMPENSEMDGIEYLGPQVFDI